MAATEKDVTVKVSVDLTDVRALGALVSVWDERRRQVGKGYTLEHDDEHGAEHLVELVLDRLQNEKSDPRELLVQCAALLIAAVETIDRATEKETE